jgi:hypothetical protein
MMRRPLFFAATNAFLVGALLQAAEIATRRVDIDILADGSYRAHVHLEVRLATQADVDAWSPLAIPLDENCALEALTGTIALPDGSTRKLRRSELDTAGNVDGSVVASSSSRRLIRLSDVPAGSTLVLDVTTLTRPYYPAGEVGGLRSPLAPTTRLAVSIRGKDARFRYRLTGDSAGLTVSPSREGVNVTGSDLPPLTLPPDSPNLASAGPHLEFGWGREGSWSDVGRWWNELISAMRPPGPRVAAAFQELALEGRRPAETVDAVLAFVHAHVRYVAVELGIGGWRPADPETTLERGWGDCKALSLLTVALLRRAGIPAVPVAAAVSDGALVDAEFPAIASFDHLVVAVPAASLGPDAILDGTGVYAFLDPTADSPDLDRFPVHLMGGRVLLLDGTNATLLSAAALPDREARRLQVALTVAADGSARGKASLGLVGESSAAWLALARTERPADLELRGRQMLSVLLPAANLLDFSWSHDGGRGSPVVLEAHISVPALLSAGRTSAWFQADGPIVTPPASALTSRSFPFLRLPQAAETVWDVRLPEGWRLAPFEPFTVSNPVAAFTETLRTEGSEARLVRRSELRRRCVEVSEIPLLREVASAEHRAQRRRLLVNRPESGEMEPKK